MNTINKYTVVCDFRSEGALAAVRRLDEDAVIEMDGVREDGHEEYTVETEWNIDQVLDNCAGVISYEKANGANNPSTIPRWLNPKKR